MDLGQMTGTGSKRKIDFLVEQLKIKNKLETKSCSLFCDWQLEKCNERKETENDFLWKIVQVSNFKEKIDALKTIRNNRTIHDRHFFDNTL